MLRLTCLIACLLLTACSQVDPPSQPARGKGADASPLMQVQPVQATDEQKSLFDALADIARQELPLDEPPVEIPPPGGDDGPLAPLLGEEDDGVIDFFQTDGWREIKARNFRNLERANRPLRIRDCEWLNVVLIVIDDLGFGDVGAFGQQQMKTPNMDLMAQTGLRFTNYYAGTGTDTPAYCSLMTGLHTGHCRLRGNRDDAWLHAGDVTIADVLWRAGYDTGMFGKWSLGDINTPGTPINQGFEETYGYLSNTQAANYYPQFLWRNDEKAPIPGNLNDRREHYSHDLVTEEALEFLERGHRRPFFLHVFFTPPRGNIDDVPSLEPYSGESWPREQKQYASMIHRVDVSVGKIMDRIYTLGLKGNTLVILTSDNGPHKDGVDPDFFKSAGPFSGIKGSLNEGGIRVPLIIWGPDFIRNSGEKTDHVCAAWDILPTIAEFTGAMRVPDNIDGISLADLIRRGVNDEHDFLYWELHEDGFAQAIRKGDWKAIRNGQGKVVQLFNLKDDPGEVRDVADSNPDVIREIAELLQRSRFDSPDWPVQLQ